uniref:Uncharacterized protein n=1 Tax=Triticum urartu TaxID=4572 RepID=A0A8R7V575_TRIUA
MDGDETLAQHPPMDGWGWGDDGGGGGLLSVLADVVDIDVGDGLQHVDIKGCGCDRGAPWRVCRPWLAMLNNRLREHSSFFGGFNGTAGVWRIKALEVSGIWMERMTVDDMDIAVQAHIKGWKFLLWFMTFLVIICIFPLRRVISSPTEKQSKEKRVGSAPNLGSLSNEGKWLRACHQRWVDGVVPRQLVSCKADGKQQCRLSPRAPDT